MKRLLLLLMSCGSGTLSASAYNQACSVDSDCVAVFEGSPCGVCGGCDNAAINTSSKAQYDRDRASAQCPPRFGGVSCGACLRVMPVCTAGKCSTR